MTIKEAILKSLEDLGKLSTHWDVYKNIKMKNYYDFKVAKTPEQTISALLGDFIRKGDSRVKRIKKPENYYEYYLTVYEDKLDLRIDIDRSEDNNIRNIETKQYSERDLHLLFSTYLNSIDIRAKTIFHEKSNTNDNNQKWIHPDIIGINFLQFKTQTTQQFIKTLNSKDTFKLTSYELKKEIRTDYELKKCYFQAVSNSSWENYGYLVAHEINSSLLNELERLNESFGIGIIELKSNPFESKILFQAKYKELDFKTIDKLCNINATFGQFIEYIEEIIINKGNNFQRVKNEFENNFCDNFLKNDEEILKYCIEKNILLEDSINE